MLDPEARQLYHEQIEPNLDTIEKEGFKCFEEVVRKCFEAAFPVKELEGKILRRMRILTAGFGTYIEWCIPNSNELQIYAGVRSCFEMLDQNNERLKAYNMFSKENSGSDIP